MANPHVVKANKYARDVVSGKIPACLQIRQACKRHLDDLKLQKRSTFPFKFNADSAEEICEFAEMLQHVKGKWKGTLIILEPWQCFALCVPFGWLRKRDGLRRYKELFWLIPRKNAKSTMGMIIGLYLLVADGEQGAEIYSAATTQAQAYEVFRPAWWLVDDMPEYREAFNISLGGTRANPGNIYSADTSSRFEVVVGKPRDGASPHGWILDEYHEAPTDVSYDAGKTGMGARTQPLMIVVSTAGVNTALPCYTRQKEIERILSGEDDTDDVFALIYTIDPEDDWTDFDVWIKANPNYGVSVFEDYLRAELKTAVQNTRKQSIMKCKHLNVWSNAGSPWLNSEDIRKCHDFGMDLEDFKGLPCYVGVDLASKIAFSSVMLMFKKNEDYYIFSRHYTTSDVIDDGYHADFPGWVKDGHIIVHQGARIDLNAIQEDIQELAREFDLSGEENGGGCVCHDPWNAAQMITNLLADGVACTEIPMTVSGISEPMKEVEAVFKEGRIHHDGNPATVWCLGNVYCEPDFKDNVFPRKETKNSKNRIDAAVATITAMARCMYYDEPLKSKYDEDTAEVLTF